MQTNVGAFNAYVRSNHCKDKLQMATSSLPRTSGIYKITCIANGKIYIGSSINIKRRWDEHRRHLRSGCHHNSLLQNAYNKYGEDVFIIEVIELIMPWVLIDMENYWLATLKPYQRDIGFNIGEKAEAGMKGRKHTPETLVKLTAASTGHIHTSEHKEKIAMALRGKRKNPEAIAKTAAFHKGRKRSPETVERLRVAKTGFRHSNDSRAKMSLAQKGRIVSVETRAKISISHIGIKPNPEQKLKRIFSLGNCYEILSPTGEVFKSHNLNQFCKDNGLSQSRMSAVSRGQQDNHRGWKVRRVE